MIAVPAEHTSQCLSGCSSCVCLKEHEVGMPVSRIFTIFNTISIPLYRFNAQIKGNKNNRTGIRKQNC